MILIYSGGGGLRRYCHKYRNDRRGQVELEIVLITDDAAPLDPLIIGRITETIPERNGHIQQTWTSILQTGVKDLPSSGVNRGVKASLRFHGYGFIDFCKTLEYFDFLDFCVTFN